MERNVLGEHLRIIPYKKKGKGKIARNLEKS